MVALVGVCEGCLVQAQWDSVLQTRAAGRRPSKSGSRTPGAKPTVDAGLLSYRLYNCVRSLVVCHVACGQIALIQVTSETDSPMWEI
jgi:hypothetical protein